MTTRPLRPCPEPGCGALVKSGRCDQHKRLLYRRQDNARGSRHDRGYGKRWDKLRLRILERDKWLCRMEGCYRDATDVDHVVPKAQGGRDEPANLQSLCSRCHAEKTAREKRHNTP